MRLESSAHDVPDLDGKDSHAFIFAKKTAPRLAREAEWRNSNVERSYSDL
jgi:hypothetical protein